MTGNAGAGKTTLSRELGGVLGVPVFSLDSVVWRSGWVKTPAVERDAAERELVAKPAWVIDGVSPIVRKAADLVLFLDVPRHVCARRGLMRSVRYMHRTRPDLPPDCPEWRIVGRLLRIIYRFPTHAGLAIRTEAALEPDRYVIVREPESARAALQEPRRRSADA